MLFGEYVLYAYLVFLFQRRSEWDEFAGFLNSFLHRPFLFCGVLLDKIIYQSSAMGSGITSRRSLKVFQKRDIVAYLLSVEKSYFYQQQFSPSDTGSDNYKRDQVLPE